jgi:hypothetical protein
MYFTSAKLLVPCILQYASQILLSRLCPYRKNSVMCKSTSTRRTATRGPTGCLIWQAVIFLYYVYSVQNIEQFRPLRIPLVVVWTRAAHTHTDNNDRCPVPRKVGQSRSRIIFGTARFESWHGHNLAYALLVFIISCRHMYISDADWATVTSFQFSILMLFYTVW